MPVAGAWWAAGVGVAWVSLRWRSGWPSRAGGGTRGGPGLGQPTRFGRLLPRAMKINGEGSGQPPLGVAGHQEPGPSVGRGRPACFGRTVTKGGSQAPSQRGVMRGR